MMDTFVIVIGSVVVGSILIWVLAYFVSDNRVVRRITRIPRRAIRDLREGELVRVVGTARAIGQDVAGPFSGTICLACHAWTGSGGSEDTVPDDVDRIVPFRVEDETGAIEVVVNRVKLALRGHKVDLGAKSGTPVFGASVIARESQALAGGSVDYWEDRLDAGAAVTVVGRVHFTGTDHVLRLAGTETEPVLISNLDRALR